MTTTPTALRERLIALLTADESAHRDTLVRLIVDRVLDTPLRDVVDPTTLASLIASWLQSAQLGRLLQDHALAGLDAFIARCAAADERLTNALPDAARAQLPALLLRKDGPTLRWLVKDVDPTPLRALIAPVIQEVLEGFTSRLPGASADSDRSKNRGGLFGRVASVGKNVMGNLGLDAKLRDLAADFSQTAANDARRALARRLTSDEGAAHLHALLSQLLDRSLDTPLTEIHADLSRLPLPDLLALLPSVASHNATRPFIHDLFVAAVSHSLALEGDQPLRTWLEESNQLDDTRAALIQTLLPIARDLLAHHDLSCWLDDLLSDALNQD